MSEEPDLSKVPMSPPDLSGGNGQAIDEKVAASIGYVASHWTLLETIIFALLITLTDMSETVAAAVFAEASFLQRVSAVASLLHLSRKSEWVDECNAIAQRLDQLRSKRNDVVHGLWSATKDSTHYLVRLKSRKKVSITTSTHNALDIRKLSGEIVYAAKSVMDFKDRMIALNAASSIRSPTGIPIDHVQSQKSRAQDQARAQKRSVARANREHAAREKKSESDKTLT